MDKNNFNKMSKIIKKEGFYLVLFLCLCIVAAVAVIKTKSRVNSVKPPVVLQPAETSDESSLNTGGLNTDNTEINNAKQVTNSNTNSNANTNANNNASNVSAAPKGTNSSAAVSAAVSTAFTRPVEGKVVRQYSEIPVAVDSTGTKWSTHLGIDIQAAKSTPVTAVLDGVVEEIGYDSDGQYVKINHQNGLKTLYANLDEKVVVKVNQKVSRGELIGKVGDTTLNGKYEQPICDFLSFKVFKGNDTADPAKYVKYELVK